jgi:hypothetical protein
MLSDLLSHAPLHIFSRLSATLHIFLFEYCPILCLAVYSFLTQVCLHKKKKQRFLSCSFVLRTSNLYSICLTVYMYTVKLRVHFFHLGSPRPKNRVLSKKRKRASKYLYFVYIYALLFIRIYVSNHTDTDANNFFINTLQ